MHSCIYGQTESGKSTLAKRLISRFQNAGYECIVFDPIKDATFNADFSTDNINEFIQRVFSSRECMIFIDESETYFKHKNPQLNKIVTMGRHWGHSVFLLAQRYTQIPPVVRMQASSISLFNSAYEDGKIHAAEWNAAELKKCVDLGRGEYFYKKRFEPLKKFKLF